MCATPGLVASTEEILAFDRAHVWHPYTSAEGHAKRPIVATRAEGALIFDDTGRALIDGNSSWWVAGLGHNPPRLVRALKAQLEKMAHVSLAGMTHEPAALLAKELVGVAPAGLTRAFFTDNGSTSIEVALRASLQYWQQNGAPKRTRFLALDGAFHGDTMGAVSVNGVDVFTKNFGGARFETVRAPVPEGSDEAAYARAFEVLADLMLRHRDEIAGIVVEPLVQGAIGMRMYPARFLAELARLAREIDTFLIVDEVFAGYGRTGKMWASNHADITPDIVCLGKTFCPLFPMGAALFTERLFEGFGGDKSRALYYGHTFAGNPLGAAVAREVLAMFREDAIIEKSLPKGRAISDAFSRLSKRDDVARVRSIGMIGALDFRANAGYFGERGWRIYDEALKRGAILRPLGDTIYVCPPLTIEDKELTRLLEIVEECVEVTA